MLANRLSVLMAERQLSIKQVVQDTGLSRNTISNITNNPESNVSTETIDKLCIYFEIDPSDFFVYSPYSITLGFKNKLMLMSVMYHKKEQLYDLSPYILNNDYDYETDARLKTFDLYIFLEADTETSKVLEVYNSLPVIFKTQLTNRILKHFENSYDTTNLKMRINEYKKYDKISIYDYLTSLKKDVFTASIKLPWADLEKTVTLTQNNHLKFI